MKGAREMKKFRSLVVLLAVSFLLMPFNAFADPRMETTKNFCHFILSPDNTDNEVFIAGCDSSIVTVVKEVTQELGADKAGSGKPNVACTNTVAYGYGTVTKEIPQVLVPIPVGTTLTYTSNDSATPCTMVESNDRSYVSSVWESRIKVAKSSTRGFVKVVYQLYCGEGTVQE
jgi:hypothetical protein